MSSLLVEVCTIDNIAKHPNADKLDIATIKGWNCIVGRNEYKPGDQVVFVPPDAIIPQNIINEHKLSYLKNGTRIRAVKLRGVVSQGLILNVPDGLMVYDGYNLAERLGITKWEPPVRQVQGQNKQRTGKNRVNPNFTKFTDIENIRHYNTIFEDGEEVVITEKIHGANWRAGYLRRSDRGFINWIKNSIFGSHEFVYGSHNVQLTFKNRGRCFYKDNPYGKVIDKYDLKNAIPEDYTLYGEVYGKGIQDLSYGIEEVDLVIFDVKYKENYLDWADFSQFCLAKGLPRVPVLYKGKFSADLIKTHTDGKTRMGKNVDQIREGCVIRPLKESNHYQIGRKVLKSVSEDYLIRDNGTEFK